MRKIFLVFFVLCLGAAVSNANPPKLPNEGTLNFSPPSGKRTVLNNGLVLYMLQDRSLPLIRAKMYVRTGNLYDPADKIGLANLAAMTMRDGGSLKYKSGEINETLEFLGASVETGMSQENAEAGMFCLSKDFGKVFDIFADIIINPAFEPEKLNLKKNELL